MNKYLKHLLDNKFQIVIRGDGESVAIDFFLPPNSAHSALSTSLFTSKREFELWTFEEAMNRAFEWGYRSLRRGGHIPELTRGTDQV